MIETRGFKIFRVFGLTFLSAVVILPLYVVLTTSIKPLADVQGLFQCRRCRWRSTSATASS